MWVPLPADTRNRPKSSHKGTDMKFFSKSSPAPSRPAVVQKPPVLEGWSENDLVSVYNAAPVRHLRKGDRLFTDLESTDCFVVVLDGSLQVVVKWDLHMGRPGILGRGDCIAPLPKSPGLLYCSEALEACTVIEITPTVLNYLPASAQLCVYRVAIQSTSRINAYIRAVNGEVTSKNARLAVYVAHRESDRRAPMEADQVRTFIKNIPRLPAFGIELAMKLIDETTSVQEVVETIKRDPATAALVLRVVNSAQYGFSKIETFYHACMILGFNNLYSLIMSEAVEATVPRIEESQAVHTHSCLASFLCYEISMAAKDVSAQTAMTLGLLHDVGKGIQILMKQARWMMPQFIDMLDSSKLGADLLRYWGLPERICLMVEAQRVPEFTPPDLVPADYRREIAVLYLSHILESLIAGSNLSDLSIYAKDYMAVLGMANTTPEQLLKDRIIPSLSRNMRRLPQHLQKHLSNYLPSVQPVPGVA